MDSDDLHRRASPLTPRYKFSTETFRQHEQFDAWCNFTATMCDLGSVAPPRSGFRASNESYHLGSMLLTSFELSPMSFTYSKEIIRKSSFDHWCIGAVTKGVVGTETDVAPDVPGAILHSIIALESGGWVVTLRTNIGEIIQRVFADDIEGTDADDTLQGTSFDESIFGLGGKDVLEGGGGDDVLDGGAGADTMTGGEGDDIYIVDHKADVVSEDTESGTDGVHASITYTLGSNVELLTLTGSKAIDGTGNELANRLTGNDGDNILRGGGGDDVLDGGAGADTMKGGRGDDLYFVDRRGDRVIEGRDSGTDSVHTSITYTLGSNVEQLVLTGSRDINGTGNGQANRLTGNDGDNLLRGGGGNDVLDGGAGADRLAGASGKDVFLFSNITDSIDGEMDTILDFNRAEKDRIDLSGLDANLTVDSDQSFDFIGARDFSGTSGELRFSRSNGNVLLEGDIDGDGSADFAVLVRDANRLVAGDFTL